MSKPVVFIHASEQPRLGAMVCVHASRRKSRHPERFEMQQAIRECNLGPDAFERLAELGCRVLAVV